VITDFISDENQECCNNELEKTLTLLHSEWSKEIEPSKQSSTHHPLIVSNPIDKKGLEFKRTSMRWEAPSMPTPAYDPHLLREQETLIQIGKDWFLDQNIPAGGFVRILDSSQVWQERVDETRIITTEGLTTCLDPGRGWTITSRRQSEQKSWRKLDSDHQRGQYYEHCSRSIVPRESKEQQRCLPLLSFSRRDEEIYSSGGKKKDRRYYGNMGEPIRTRK